MHLGEAGHHQGSGLSEGADPTRGGAGIAPANRSPAVDAGRMTQSSDDRPQNLLSLSTETPSG